MTGAVQPGRPTRIRVPIAAVASLALLVIAVLSLAPAVSTSLAQQRAIADETARIAGQRADLRRLDAAVARWDDPAYVRAQAGSRLFYVTPGTTAYRVIHASPAQGGTRAVATATDAGWTSTLLDSLISAGTTTERGR